MYPDRVLKTGEIVVERPAERWLEGQDRLQVDTAAPSQDRSHQVEDFRGTEHGNRFRERFRLHVQGRPTGSVLLLSGNDHMVRSGLSL